MTTKISKSELMYVQAYDWAFDLVFSPDHAYMTGMPYGFNEKPRNAACRVLVDALLVLDPKALIALME